MVRAGEECVDLQAVAEKMRELVLEVAVLRECDERGIVRRVVDRYFREEGRLEVLPKVFERGVGWEGFRAEYDMMYE